MGWAASRVKQNVFANRFDDWKYLYLEGDEMYLYNLANDTNELNDRSGDQEWTAIEKELADMALNDRDP